MARHPDIRSAIPTVIAGNPNKSVLRRRTGTLHDRRRRSHMNMPRRRRRWRPLRERNRGGQTKRTQKNERNLFFHRGESDPFCINDLEIDLKILCLI